MLLNNQEEGVRVEKEVEAEANSAIIMLYFILECHKSGRNSQMFKFQSKRLSNTVASNEIEPAIYLLNLLLQLENAFILKYTFIIMKCNAFK